MATVHIQSVSKVFEKQCILDNINLSIEKGEFVAIVGPSGSGKSTLLRMIAGLEKVSSGTILINNRCVNTIPPAKRNMAMVFQNYALYPHMTVYNNMAYGLKMRGMKKAAIAERVTAVAELLKLSPFLERKPAALSGGQRQRVAMGRAIVRKPAVFLFDEPLSNLDAKLRSEMRLEIKKLHKQLNTTCIYVTHDQVEAMTLADKIVIMNHGKVEQIGSPQELFNKPETVFAASFIGHYPMNFIKAKIDTSETSLLTELGQQLALPNINLDVIKTRDLLIGIRPEHICVQKESNQKSILSKIEFVEDMGSDKLLQVIANDDKGTPLLVRILDDIQLNNDEIQLSFMLQKANVFCADSGQRLGGWDA